MCELTGVRCRTKRPTHLANRECSRRLDKVWPKVLPDMLRRVDTQPVNLISLDDILDPSIHGLHNILVLRVQVRERKILVTDPTLLNVRLVVVVRDLAVRVVVRLRGERLDEREIEGLYAV